MDLVSGLQRVLCRCDLPGVVGAALLNVGRLGDFLPHDQLLDQTFEPGVVNARRGSWQTRFSIVLIHVIRDATRLIASIDELFHQVLRDLRLVQGK